jgi:hypothetical protein
MLALCHSFMESFLTPHDGIMFTEQCHPSCITQALVEERRMLNIRKEDGDGIHRGFPDRASLMQGIPRMRGTDRQASNARLVLDQMAKGCIEQLPDEHIDRRGLCRKSPKTGKLRLASS